MATRIKAEPSRNGAAELHPDVDPERVALNPLAVKVIQVPIVGLRPLLVCRMQMIEPGAKKLSQEATFLRSLYVVDGQAGKPGAVYGFPAAGFHRSLVDSRRFYAVQKQKEGKEWWLGVVGMEGDPATDYTPIKFGSLRMDTRAARTKQGAVITAVRGMFLDWSCVLTVRFNDNQITPDRIINQLNVAGFHVGIGNLRKQKGGSYGLFGVAKEKE